MSTRSATTPAITERNRIGSVWSAETRPSAAGESVRSRTSQPWAVACIHEPTDPTMAPARNRRKTGDARAGTRVAMRPGRAVGAGAGSRPGSSGVVVGPRRRRRPRCPGCRGRPCPGGPGPPRPRRGLPRPRRPDRPAPRARRRRPSGWAAGRGSPRSARVPPPRAHRRTGRGRRRARSRRPPGARGSRATRRTSSALTASMAER